MPGSEPLEREYRERVARAVDYIEARLGEPLSLERAAAESAWSFFHFHRVFSAVVGLPPGEYLRMRRLTEGARLLASGREPVAAVARAVGFGSAEAFHRSFKAEFGLAPAAYRRSASSLALLNPFLPNERPLAHRAPCLVGEPSVEVLEERRLACASSIVGLERGELLDGVRRLWSAAGSALGRAAAASRGASRGADYPGAPRGPYYGLAEPAPGAGGRAILYLAGAGVSPSLGDGAIRGLGLEPYRIAAGPYLRALHRGPASRLNETYLYLYGSWLPRAGLEPGAPMDFDEYGPGYRASDPESPESEVVFRIPLGKNYQAR